ncbi:GB1/RHD3-type G domain-containing protein [Psidium guajava]|nr:GB1/RHD3-type G domain-containing protein [Psidium guajava]
MMRLFNRGRDAPSDASPQSYAPSPSSSPASVTGPARPIRLVYCDEKGRFRMDPEAVAVLQLVKEPIGVVSVCGRARQGKSFILNQLLGKSSGFQVASTHRPCTKGLWLWSVPLKRRALDGTEYNLLLLDSEGIDAYDQTGTYSTQIFSLAVLLSSMFIYNQMGGIDEAALDRLSLVTQMTKHIRVRASGGKSSASELGQFSPIFVWLLRDFYLDLVEDNRRITPRDYLELALRPVQGTGRDIAAKNEIRDSIRALFPDRECFTLVRPLNNENDLQRLDQISMDKLRPEFRSGLEALTKFVFERTRPKQVGATVLTGPVLIGVTESYLEALIMVQCLRYHLHGRLSVEEAECRRAYDSATEVYMSTFDRSKAPEEAGMREAHEEAVQKSLAAFNASAVGAGSARKKHEELLHKFFRRAFEDYKRNAFMEADLQCSNAIQNMEKRLRAACHTPDANVDNVVKVLDALLSEYEASSHGPSNGKSLQCFCNKGPILDLAKRLIDRVGSERSSLMLKCRAIEDQLSDDYSSRITKLQSTSSLLEERSSSLLKALESSKQESQDWKRKYEQVLSKQKAEEDQASSEIAILKSRSSAAEARLAAAKEQAQSAQEEAEEWKRKYDIAVREAKAALEKAAISQERTNKDTQKREDALRAEFSIDLAAKEEEVKEKVAKIEYAEQCLITIKSELKAAESKIENYDVEIMSLKSEIRALSEKFETANAKAQSFEREARIVEQEKVHLEQKYLSAFKRFEEVEERCRNAEKEARRSTEMADKARADAITAQKEKNNIQRLAMERLAQIERAERLIESLGRDKITLEDQLKEARISETEALSKVTLLEARVEEREKEIESLLDSNNEQRASTVKVLESLLDTERKARAEANSRAEDLSVKLQSAQAKIDSLQQKLTTVLINETALDSKLKTASLGKRLRADDADIGMESVQDMDIDKASRVNKRSRSTTSPLKHIQPEDGGSMYKGDEDNHSNRTLQEDYTKFTMLRLRQELTSHDFGAELLQLKNPSKKDLLALYEKLILQKS